MARIRTIKPDFFKNEDLAEIPAMTRLLFVGLWTQADREGRLRDRPKRLKIELFPYDNYDVEKGLQQLETAGFIVRYKANVNVSDRVLPPEQPAEEVSLIQVLNFLKHQQPNKKEAESMLPAPYQHSANILPAQSKHGASMVLAQQEREREMEMEGKGNGREGDFANADKNLLSGSKNSEEESPPVAPAPPSYIPTFTDVDLLKEKVFLDKEHFVRVYVGWGIAEDQVYSWLVAFNSFLKYRGETKKLERDYRSHFGNWLKLQDLQSDPENYSPVTKNENGNSKNNSGGGKSTYGKSAGAIELARSLADDLGLADIYGSGDFDG